MSRRYSGNYDEFPGVISRSMRNFKSSFKDFPNNAVLTLAIEPYKGHKGQKNGFFYVGIRFFEMPNSVPQEMDMIHLEGDYVYVRDHLNMAKLHTYFRSLEKWIAENSHHHRKDPNGLQLELYYPNPSSESGLDIEVCIPLKRDDENKMNH